MAIALAVRHGCAERQWALPNRALTKRSTDDGFQMVEGWRTG
ncbi:hypothetical protein [Scytonema sp. PCC 10023]